MWSLTHETSGKVVKLSILLGDVYFLPTQEILRHPVYDAKYGYGAAYGSKVAAEGGITGFQDGRGFQGN